jgi:hypothetical protein
MVVIAKAKPEAIQTSIILDCFRLHPRNDGIDLAQ